MFRFGTGPFSLPRMLQMFGMVVGIGNISQPLWLAWGGQPLAELSCPWSFTLPD